MVSANSNPTSDSAGSSCGGGMALGGVMVSLSATSTAAGAGVDDPSKKIRKPYTITKSRENWTDQEHDKFLEALQLFDRDWKKIEAFVSSKTVIQIRSHAQKYFLKVQKNGTSEHVPPPRPKRKAAHPYPQKASKNVPLLSQPAIPFHASFLEQGFAPLSSIPGTVSSWTHTSNDPGSSNMMNENMTNNYSGTESALSPNTHPAGEINGQGNQVASSRGMPDFSEVYGFIGSIFDQCRSDQLETLNDMKPIDAETVLLLMRNLSMNLTNPDFEDHRMLIASYGVDAEDVSPMDTIDETDPFMFNAE